MSACGIVAFVLVLSIAHACVLCPSRIPTRPKPLDQFRLPSIKKLLDTTNAIRQLCNNDTLQVSEECRADVSHLFCSLNSLVQYWQTECPGRDQVDECQECQLKAAQIYQKNAWIMTWVDSIGKMPAGISDGNYHWLGDYEQCHELKLEKKFNGHYCLVQFEVPDDVLSTQCEDNPPLEVHLGICLPSSCTIAETKALIEDVAQHEMNVQCEPPTQWPKASVIFLCCCLFWLSIVLLMTGYIWLQPHDQGRLYKIADALSLQHNLRKCLRTIRPECEQEFRAVAGLQVVSLFFLIAGSVFFLMMPYLENVSFAYRSSESALMQPIVNYSFLADGLLALAALQIGLRAYRGGFDDGWRFPRFFLSRLFHVWPSYAFVTGFATLLFIRLGSGPMWSHNDLPDRCEHSWWANLLLINNMFGVHETCLDGGFLFALELQFYLFALFLLWIRSKTRMVANLLAVGSIVVSLLYVFVIGQIYKTYATLIPTAAAFKEQDQMYMNFVNKIYLNPIARIAPFLIGLFSPIWFRHKTTQTQKLFTPSCMLIGAVVFFFIVWTPYLVDGTESYYLYSLYAALHRSVWAVAVLTLAFIFNSISDSNVFKAVLSWRTFYPMGKLAFLVFLISEPVALSLFSSLHRPINATLFSILLTSIGTFVCSYILAVIVEVTVALPVRYLLEAFLSIESEPEAPASPSHYFRNGDTVAFVHAKGTTPLTH